MSDESNYTPARLGKTRGIALPQEYHLTRLVQNITKRHESWTTATKACDWHGVRCNAQKDVTSFQWSEYNIPTSSLSGTLEWSGLPHSTRKFVVSHNHLQGELVCEKLPTNLEELDLTNNRFSGTPQFSSLPPNLRILTLRNNRFSGELSFSKLPSRMVVLNLGLNKFSGAPELRFLPCFLEELYLSDNHLSGWVNLALLPHWLTVLHLHNNLELSGELLKPSSSLSCNIQATKITIKYSSLRTST